MMTTAEMDADSGIDLNSDFEEVGDGDGDGAGAGATGKTLTFFSFSLLFIFIFVFVFLGFMLLDIIFMMELINVGTECTLAE